MKQLEARAISNSLIDYIDENSITVNNESEALDVINDFIAHYTDVMGKDEEPLRRFLYDDIFKDAEYPINGGF
jgi:hypothetical protein